MSELTESHLTPQELVEHADQMLSDEQRKKVAEKMAEIHIVSQEAETLSYDTEHSIRYQDLEEYHPEELRRQLLPLLKDKVLIDLGCGIDFNRGIVPSTVLKLADRGGVSKYIGVEKYGDPHTEYFEYKYPESQMETEIHGNTDMLEFVSTLPDDSANITINGIDDEIIDPNIPANDQYLKLLTEQIVRVIGENNIVFGIGSNVVFRYLEKLGLSRERILDTIELMRADRAKQTDR